MDVAPNSIREVAAEVGEAYLSARPGNEAPIVRAAYTKLQCETDRLFSLAVRSDGPGAVRIAFTRSVEPYADDQELIVAVRATRTLEITTAAVHSDRVHPVLGCEAQGPFDRFRAVHDLIGHARAGLGFGLTDELAAWRTQDRLHSRLARRALATEILGVNSARFVLGETPEQKAILLDRDLLVRCRVLLAAREVRARPIVRRFP